MALTPGQRLDALLKVNLGSGTVKAVLLILDHHAGRSGQCFPSNKTIATEANVSLDTVIRALATLREIGVLTTAPRFDKSGRQSSNGQTIDYDKVCELAGTDREGGQDAAEGGQGAGGEGGHHAGGRGGKVRGGFHEPLNEPLIRTEPGARTLLWNQVSKLYDAYPKHRRNGKGSFTNAVRPAWAALVASGDPNPSETLEIAVRAYAASWVATHDGGKGCQGPERFFGGTWEQDPSDWGKPHGGVEREDHGLMEGAH